MCIENHPDIKHLIGNGISAFMDNSETLIILHSDNLHTCINPVILVIWSAFWQTWVFLLKWAKKNLYR